jgi:hypothetical protein
VTGGSIGDLLGLPPAPPDEEEVETGGGGKKKRKHPTRKPSKLSDELKVYLRTCFQSWNGHPYDRKIFHEALAKRTKVPRAVVTKYYYNDRRRQYVPSLNWRGGRREGGVDEFMLRGERDLICNYCYPHCVPPSILPLPPSLPS